MTRSSRKKSERIQAFIVRNVEDQSGGLVGKAMKEFAISRQAVHKHLRKLVDGKLLSHTGGGQYQVCILEESKKILAVADNPQEDIVWRTQVRDMIGALPRRAVDIWHYGFTEMFNNVVEHSESESAFIQVKKTASSTRMTIWDRGVGIFNKIRTHMNLLDERHAVLELTKGKLTTDPAAHSGQGIFFATRAFDTFSILSGGVFLSHNYDDGGSEWTLEIQQDRSGTLVTMVLRNDTSRVMKDIFDTFSSTDTPDFSSTVVPAHLAQYENEKLVSRSEARRLLERADRFKTVLVDFNGIESIGQAFADEIFRVYARRHPGVQLREIRAAKEVQDMVNRARQNTDIG